jgi:NitT/TauT family transport system substrate-binding protein
VTAPESTPTGESAVPTATAASVTDTTPTQGVTTARPTPTIDRANPTKVTVALGYIPDVQFAPFYVAKDKSFYEELGLDVTFKHGIVPDLIKLLGAGEEGINFAAASGDEIIQASLQDIPVVYVMTWYRQYPVAAASIVGKGPTLKSPADLKGRTVGVPGPYGATYTGLLALLKAGGLTLEDIQLKSIGFTQVESLATGQVDVAMVYAANEPTQLRAQGHEVSTLMVSDHARLAANGLVTNRQTIKDNQLLVWRMVQATQKGIEYTIANPGEAFEIALKEVPEAGGENSDRQKQVLQETIKLMVPRPGDPGLGFPTGYTDPQVWADTQDFLYDAKIISEKGKIAEMFTNRFIATSGQ